MSRPHFRKALAPVAAVAAAAAVGLLAVASLPARAQGPVAPPVMAAPASGPAPTANGAPCVMLFGQGRNFDPDQPAANRRWDEANGAFNLAARSRSWQPASP
ncbi:hypothetical protein ACQ86G_05705 [Roseateles chitinivorans]|uniref:hypothetical protein n=1 Tax=Roseateles chitinivorans TaxID=2917965 RepID=UPI003D668E2C